LKPLLYLKKNYPLWKRAFLIENDIDDQTIRNGLNKLETTILHPHADLVTENRVCPKNWPDLTIYPWISMRGEDDIETRMKLWKRLHKLAIKGVCTNYPREFKAWLDSLSK
jgi:glycerophosphoryl diester phosphodiesterase